GAADAASSDASAGGADANGAGGAADANGTGVEANGALDVFDAGAAGNARDVSVTDDVQDASATDDAPDVTVTDAAIDDAPPCPDDAASGAAYCSTGGGALGPCSPRDGGAPHFLFTFDGPSEAGTYYGFAAVQASGNANGGTLEIVSSCAAHRGALKFT